MKENDMSDLHNNMTINRHDETYKKLLRKILAEGEERKDRTGVGTISIFGTQLQFDISDTFPALTTKRIAWKAVVSELLWFLEGCDDDRRLAVILNETTEIEDAVKAEEIYTNSAKYPTIWTANAEAPYWKEKALYNGHVGAIYGVQWRFWNNDINGPDQVQNVIDGIKKDPYGRRHIISAWNPAQLDKMCLPPCHVLCQFYVTNSGRLDCHMYQRSVDTFLGLPFNIASYSLLVYLIAQCTDLKPGKLTMSLGDTHIYSNHVDQVNEQLSRAPKEEPKLIIKNPSRDLPLDHNFKVGDFVLENYNPHPTIKAPMAV
jgi:thymidylate synthase